MRPIEEWCAISFISDRAYDNRTGGEKSAENPIDLTLRPTLTSRSSEREFRRNM